MKSELNFEVYCKHTYKRSYCTQLHFACGNTVTDNSISLKFSTLVSVRVCSTRGRVGQCTKYRARTLLGCRPVGVFCDAEAGTITTRLIATWRRENDIAASESKSALLGIWRGWSWKYGNRIVSSDSKLYGNYRVSIVFRGNGRLYLSMNHCETMILECNPGSIAIFYFSLAVLQFQLICVANFIQE